MNIALDPTNKELVLNGKKTRRIEDLVAIGEYTRNGPLLADWFLVLVFVDGMTWTCPINDTVDLEFLEALASQLGSTLTVDLANSTTWAHRVLYPRELVGRPLFETRPRTQRGLRSKLTRALGLGQHEEWAISREILKNRAAASES